MHKARRIRTNVGSNSGKDHLTFARCLHCCSKVGIVPGIDLSVAANERCIGIQVENLFWQKAVWTMLGAGGQNNRYIEGLCNCSMGNHIVAEDCWVVVAHLDCWLGWV